MSTSRKKDPPRENTTEKNVKVKRDAETEVDVDAAVVKEEAMVRADPSEDPERTEESMMMSTEKKEESTEETMMVSPEAAVVAVEEEVKAPEVKTDLTEITMRIAEESPAATLRMIESIIVVDAATIVAAIVTRDAVREVKDLLMVKDPLVKTELMVRDHTEADLKTMRVDLTEADSMTTEMKATDLTEEDLKMMVKADLTEADLRVMVKETNSEADLRVMATETNTEADLRVMATETNSEAEVVAETSVVNVTIATTATRLIILAL